MRQGAAAEQRSSRRLAVVFLLAAIGLLIVGPRIEPVAGIFSPIFAPIDSVVSGIADDLGAAVSSLTELPRLQGEIKALRRQNAVLVRRDAMEPVYARENAKLSRMLNFRDLNPHLELVAARRIGIGTIGLSPVVVINAGSNQGLRVGNPVLDPNGFVIGKVTEVWRAAAKVGPLTADRIWIPAMDSKTGANGLVGTPVGTAPQFQVQTGQRVHNGDLIVTSGLFDEFPPGSVIGQVTKAQVSNVRPRQYAALRTAANLNNIELVQVVRNFGPGTHVGYPSILTNSLP